MSQIPGLVLPGLGLSSGAATPQQNAVSPSASEPTAAAFSAAQLDVLRQLMHSIPPAQLSSLEISVPSQPPSQQVGADQPMMDLESTEDGELSDDLPGASYSDQAQSRARKRKASISADDRNTKVRAVRELVSSVSDDRQGQQAAHVVATLLNNGFPFQQLVQDITGIMLARRQQAQMAQQPSSQPENALVEVAMPSATSAAPLSLSQPQKQTPAPPKSAARDAEAYKAKLEALKSKRVARAPPPKPSTPAVVAIGNKLDREKLKAKIAALRAENAKKNVQPSVPDSAPATPAALPHIQSKAGTKQRVSAIDLIEASTGSENSPRAGVGRFSPMGVDREDSMIIEASSSEESDDEADNEDTGADSSDKLTGLESDIARFKAQIAARLSKRKRVTGKNVLPPMATESVAHSSSSRDAADDTTLHQADHAALEMTQSEIDIPVASDLIDEVLSGTQTEAGLSELRSTVLDDQNTETQDVSLNQAISNTGALQPGPALESVDFSNASEEDDGYMSDDDAPMSIDSGGEPTPGLSTEAATRQASVDADEDSGVDDASVASGQSGSMEISHGSSTEDDTASDALADDPDEDMEADVPGDVQRDDAKTNISTDGESEEDDSEDDYDPGMVGEIGDRASEHSDMSMSPSASLSSASHNDDWRLHPAGIPSSGVTILHESGAAPPVERAVSRSAEIIPQQSFVPYQSRLRFHEDVIIGPPSPER